MKQVSNYGWEIVSEQGAVLQKDITFSSTYHATEYIKAYISSFLSWDYDILLLDGGPNENTKKGTK